MNKEWILIIVPILIGLIQAFFFFYLAKAYKERDKEEKTTNEKFVNLTKSLSQLTTNLTYLTTKFGIIETQIAEYKKLFDKIDDVKFLAHKAIDSAKRAHHRIDKNEDNIKEFHQIIFKQERILIKLNVVTESLQERLKDIIDKVET